MLNASIIRGYDPQDGKELWSLSPTSIQVVASPVVGSDYAIVSSGYPPARPIYAVKPGLRGKRLLHHRRGVDEDFDLAAGERLNLPGKHLQLFLDGVVIIGALRVDGDGAARALFQNCQRIAAASVIQPEQNHAARLRP